MTSDDDQRQGNAPRSAVARADSRGSIVVFTAITREYDNLKEQPRAATEGADFVAFLDVPRESATWQVRPVHTEFRDPCRNAKIHKVLPHVYFPDARYSLWIDGSVTIRFTHTIQRLTELYLADCDLMVFRHRTRTCIYQEAAVCLHRHLDDPAVVWNQISRYSREGYPPNLGLAECTVVLRRHTAAVNAFNEAWWEEITQSSRRDQLSFPYVARKTRLRYGMFPQTLDETPLFHREVHPSAVVRRSDRFSARIASNRSWVAAAMRATVISLGSPLRRRFRDPPSWLLDAAAVPRGGALTDVTVAESRGDSAAANAPNGDHVPTTVALRVDGDTAGISLRAPLRRTIAFGPVRDLPSWNWVGFDTARELSKYYDVVFYRSWSTLPDCDVVFAIKERPPDSFVSTAQRKRVKLVYCPIDAYSSPDQLARDAGLFHACAMVLVHSERLLPCVQTHCANTHFVEHHVRYALTELADYRDSGFVLWIGGCQYVPYLMHWLAQHPIESEVRILTDITNYRARHVGRVFAAEIGMKFGVYRNTKSIGRYRVYQWNERRQLEMMQECRAAIDVKLTDKFEQYYKPPTKAQQFVASGVPFAVNPDSYSAEYFRARGFDVASPADPDRWLSRAYWEATRRYAAGLRTATSLAAVGERYRKLIESLWTPADAQSARP